MTISSVLTSFLLTMMRTQEGRYSLISDQISLEIAHITVDQARTACARVVFCCSLENVPAREDAQLYVSRHLQVTVTALACTTFAAAQTLGFGHIPGHTAGIC